MKAAAMEARRDAVFGRLKRGGWDHPSYWMTWRLERGRYTLHSLKSGGFELYGPPHSYTVARFNEFVPVSAIVACCKAAAADPFARPEPGGER